MNHLPINTAELGLHTVGCLNLSQPELALCKTIYRLVGFRECGVVFEPDEVPVSHMWDLCQHYLEWHAARDVVEKGGAEHRAQVGQLMLTLGTCAPHGPAHLQELAHAA